MLKSLNSFHLKVIAISSMLINHIGYTFKEVFASPIWTFAYLSIGLLTYPIMAYLLVQGFYYTRNRWKYAGRLALFWLISILPFHFAFDYKNFLNPFNNVMFTLMMGCLLMIVCEKVTSPVWQKFMVCLFAGLTSLSDWPIIGILIIYGFYKTYGRSVAYKWIITAAAVFLIVVFSLKIPDRHILSGDPVVDITSRLGLFGVLPLLNRYNGKRGYSPIWVKWGFYAFYPLHLLILAGVREFLN